MFQFSFFLVVSVVTPLKKLNQAVALPRRTTYPPQTWMQQICQGDCCNLKLQCCRPWASSCGVLSKPLALNKQTLVDLCLISHTWLHSCHQQFLDCQGLGSWPEKCHGITTPYNPLSVPEGWQLSLRTLISIDYDPVRMGSRAENRAALWVPWLWTSSNEGSGYLASFHVVGAGLIPNEKERITASCSLSFP